jgi:uncharacterized membrane protein YoaK (UPF0700 family)
MSSSASDNVNASGSNNAGHTASTGASNHAGSVGDSTTRGAMLSFLAGYADTVGFVALGGLFTAHVTGNFVLLGYALVGPVQGIVPKLLAFPVFVLAIAITRLLIARWQRGGQPALSRSMLLQMGLLAASSACAFAWSMMADGTPVKRFDAPLPLACGMLAVAASCCWRTCRPPRS